MSPMSPINTPEILKNAKKEDNVLRINSACASPGATAMQGCKTFEIAAQHPRGFYGGTAHTINPQSLETLWSSMHAALSPPWSQPGCPAPGAKHR